MFVSCLAVRGRRRCGQRPCLSPQRVTLLLSMSFHAGARLPLGPQVALPGALSGHTHVVTGTCHTEQTAEGLRVAVGQRREWFVVQSVVKTTWAFLTSKEGAALKER